MTQEISLVSPSACPRFGANPPHLRPAASDTLAARSSGSAPEPLQRSISAVLSASTSAPFGFATHLRLLFPRKSLISRISRQTFSSSGFLRFTTGSPGQGSDHEIITFDTDGEELVEAFGVG